MLDDTFMKYLENIVRSFKAKDDFYITITNGFVFVYEGISIKWVPIKNPDAPVFPENMEKIYGVRQIKAYAKAVKMEDQKTYNDIVKAYDYYGGLPMFEGEESCSPEVKLYNFIQKTRMLIYKCNDIFNLIENNTLCEYKCGATDVFNTVDPISKIGSLKSEDGATLVKLTDHHVKFAQYTKPTFITMFKGLVPYNATDRVDLTVYSINYNDYFLFQVKNNTNHVKFNQLISTLKMA